jgi:hypothetical protein
MTRTWNKYRESLMKIEDLLGRNAEGGSEVNECEAI